MLENKYTMIFMSLLVDNKLEYLSFKSQKCKLFLMICTCNNFILRIVNKFSETGCIDNNEACLSMITAVKLVIVHYL